MFNGVLYIVSLHLLESKKSIVLRVRNDSLAVVWFTRHFGHYLQGRPFDIRTDHGSLQ